MANHRVWREILTLVFSFCIPGTKQLHLHLDSAWRWNKHLSWLLSRGSGHCWLVWCPCWAGANTRGHLVPVFANSPSPKTRALHFCLDFLRSLFHLWPCCSVTFESSSRFADTSNSLANGPTQPSQAPRKPRRRTCKEKDAQLSSSSSSCRCSVCVGCRM